MAVRIQGWAGLSLAMALAAGCGSGGPEAGGRGVPAGPSEGQSPGFGARQESPGQGFDKADEHQESPGGGWRPGGSTGPGPGPGPGGGGGGGGGGDYVGACKRLCERGAQACGIDESECKGDCDELSHHFRGHVCESTMRAAYACADRASSVRCEDGEVEPAGCEKEGSDFLACLIANGDLDFTPPGSGSDFSEDWKLPSGDR